MNWMTQLIRGESIAHAVLVIAVVAALGLALGSLKFHGIGLGIAGVLFSGLAIGHFGITISQPVLEFAREFGLILFVYTIGMQVGPGFFASLRRQGLPLNAMAASIVLLGAAITVGITKFAGVSMAAAVGLFAGGTTNTPSLGAAQEALKSLPDLAPGLSGLPGLGYAVAYPFGIVGIILSMLAIRSVFRVDLKKETAAVLAAGGARPQKLSRVNLLITNRNLDGRRIDEIPILESLGVVISRIHRGGVISLGRPEEVIRTGDTILAVGPPEKLDELRIIVGEPGTIDLRTIASHLVMRRVIVTKKAILGRSLGELDVFEQNEVTVTRVTRAEIELSATPDRRLQFGDMLVLVGREEDITKVADFVGNSVKQLNHTELIPVFVGIGLGVLLGSVPLAFPGIPVPVKLGLAGGPLLVAILLSRIGRIGPLLWYMPNNANFAIREIGIVLFLSCVGLHSGERFVDTLVHGDGIKWMLLAMLITVVPLLVVGCVGRIALRMNYVTLCGLLAGSMTDPPALAFANTVSGSDAPSISYATVYPLTMLLRVVCAQVLVLLFL
ncbi:MAG TPA: putative transporter [Terrimicrobiaceae bacterium]|nr:putative transporter [Terrimicrobiaceae bacterium]